MNAEVSCAPKQDMDNFIRTAYEDGIQTASIEVHGDKWCVFGNDLGIVDDSSVFSKRYVFGFALVNEIVFSCHSSRSQGEC